MGVEEKPVITFDSYNFPYVQNWSRNFANKRRAQVVLPGASGAFNTQGDFFSPAQAGQVDVAFKLVAETREAMDDLRDGVYALAHRGLKQLVFQPTGAEEPTRFCWAEVDSISMPEDKANHSDLIQNVSIVFNVPDPRLFGASLAMWSIGDGSDVGDPGLVIGGGGDVHVVSGELTQIVVTNGGNAPTIPVITVVPGVGNTVSEGIGIYRVEGGLYRDFVEHGPFAGTDELYLNGKTHRATLNGNPTWDNLYYGHNNFIVLMPGENDFDILMADAGDDATVIFYFFDTWI